MCSLNLPFHRMIMSHCIVQGWEGHSTQQVVHDPGWKIPALWIFSSKKLGFYNQTGLPVIRCSSK